MRPINMIFLDIMEASSLPEKSLEWKKNGLVFAPYHFMIHFEGAEQKPVVTRGRPVCLDNGLMRDSFIQSRSIGIAIVTKDGRMTHNHYESVAKIAKNILMDIGVKEFQIATDYRKKDNKIDVNKMFNLIKDAKHSYIQYVDVEVDC